jgi:hypothetical protein
MFKNSSSCWSLEQPAERLAVDAGDGNMQSDGVDREHREHEHDSGAQFRDFERALQGADEN